MARSPFVVHVSRLRRRPGNRWHEIRRGPIDDLSGVGSRVEPGSPVEADLVLEAVGGRALTAVGTVTARWTGECRRCLGLATGTLEVPVRETYSEGGTGEETYPLVDDTVDLEPLARDAVLLELPIAPLCRDGCRGLCPHCGADRNLGDCDCRAPGDPRWGALDVLRDL